MQRFLELLHGDLERAGVDVELVTPRPLTLGRRMPPRARNLLEKLTFEVGSLGRRGADVVHVVDQGDAGHVLVEPARATVVTCHDISVLTDPTYLGAPGTHGRLHRRALLWRMRRGLERAGALVCDSEDTLRDVSAALPPTPRQLRARVYLPLRFPAPSSSGALPAAVTELARPYVLHVGSNGFRKNRPAVLEVVKRSTRDLGIVFAGQPPDPALLARAAELGLRGRIAIVTRPTDTLLATLYREAHCLLFPSTFEGFGWPIVEAQLSGCPVVASNVTSLPEVARAGALLAGPHDHATLAGYVDSLFDAERRASLVAEGRANAELFRGIELGREYLAVYEALLTARRRR